MGQHTLGSSGRSGRFAAMAEGYHRTRRAPKTSKILIGLASRLSSVVRIVANSGAKSAFPSRQKSKTQNRRQDCRSSSRVERVLEHVLAHDDCGERADACSV